MAKVYSTDQGRLCPGCEQPIDACRCGEKTAPKGDGIVRVQRQTKGRGGKAVTVVTGLELDRSALSQLLKELKRRLGTGGAVKQFDLEIQGDRRTEVAAELEKQGFKVKLSGG